MPALASGNSQERLPGIRPSDSDLGDSLRPPTGNRSSLGILDGIGRLCASTHSTYSISSFCHKARLNSSRADCAACCGVRCLAIQRSSQYRWRSSRSPSLFGLSVWTKRRMLERFSRSKSPTGARTKAFDYTARLPAFRPRPIGSELSGPRGILD